VVSLKETKEEKKKKEEEKMSQVYHYRITLIFHFF